MGPSRSASRAPAPPQCVAISSAAIDTAVGGVAVTDAEETYSVSPKTRP